ncbi:MAG: glutathione S-transferase N-terminal domain-containing protein [Calditrichota bacterium]|jgi:glutaredoxin
MIRFYRTKDCPDCSAIQETMEDLSLAHKVVMVKDRAELPVEIPKNTRLPVMEDGEEIIQGHDQILHHLEELENFKAEWDKFQSDACYCDDEGNIE